VRTLDRERATLVVVDVQEAFRPAVEGFDGVVENTRRLMEGAKILGVPVVVTEQYPKGLGRTVDELGDVEAVEKTCFSAARADGFDLDGRDQALVCGIETHVCVNQSVLDLLDRDVEVHVARDAVGSRSAENKELGLHKVEQAGAVLTSVETALFELVRKAGTDDFKQVQKVVLEYAP
jgi:nicotinamidase-related amidase